MAGNSVGTRLYTWLRGEEVGKDQFGNRYFRGKGSPRGSRESIRRERRWVIYSGEVEASRVPPEWHAWLHHTADSPPPEGGVHRYPWQRDYLPNMTGTIAAYRPPGHTLEGGYRERATGDYEPWIPE